MTLMGWRAVEPINQSIISLIYFSLDDDSINHHLLNVVKTFRDYLVLIFLYDLYVRISCIFWSVSFFFYSDGLAQPLIKCRRVFQALINIAIEELCEIADSLIAPVRMGVARPTAPFALVCSSNDAILVRYLATHLEASFMIICVFIFHNILNNLLFLWKIAHQKEFHAKSIWFKLISITFLYLDNFFREYKKSIKIYTTLYHVLL